MSVHGGGAKSSAMLVAISSTSMPPVGSGSAQASARAVKMGRVSLMGIFYKSAVYHCAL